MAVLIVSSVFKYVAYVVIQHLFIHKEHPSSLKVMTSSFGLHPHVSVEAVFVSCEATCPGRNMLQEAVKYYFIVGTCWHNN